MDKEVDSSLYEAACEMEGDFNLLDLLRKYNSFGYKRIPYGEYGHRNAFEYIKRLPFIKRAGNFVFFELKEGYRDGDMQSGFGSASGGRGDDLSEEDRLVLQAARKMASAFRISDLIREYNTLHNNRKIKYNPTEHTSLQNYLKTRPFLSEHGIHPMFHLDESYVHEEGSRSEEKLQTAKSESSASSLARSSKSTLSNVDSTTESKRILKVALSMSQKFRLEELCNTYRLMFKTPLSYQKYGYSDEFEYLRSQPFLKTNGNKYSVKDLYLLSVSSGEDTEDDSDEIGGGDADSKIEEHKNFDECEVKTSASISITDMDSHKPAKRIKKIDANLEAQLVLDAALTMPTSFHISELPPRYKKMYKGRSVPFMELGFGSEQEYMEQLPFINKIGTTDKYMLDKSFLVASGWWTEQDPHPRSAPTNSWKNIYSNGDGNKMDHTKNVESAKILTIAQGLGREFSVTDILQRYRALYSNRVPLQKMGYPSVSQFLSSLPFLEKLGGGRGFKLVDRENSEELKNFEKTVESDTESVKTAIENQEEANFSKESDITVYDEKNEDNKAITEESEMKMASDEYDTAPDEEKEEENNAKEKIRQEMRDHLRAEQMEKKFAEPSEKLHSVDVFGRVFEMKQQMSALKKEMEALKIYEVVRGLPAFFREADIVNAYRNTFGEEIPYEKLGFVDVNEFLKSLAFLGKQPDMIKNEENSFERGGFPEIPPSLPNSPIKEDEMNSMVVQQEPQGISQKLNLIAYRITSVLRFLGGKATVDEVLKTFFRIYSSTLLLDEVDAVVDQPKSDIERVDDGVHLQLRSYSGPDKEAYHFMESIHACGNRASFASLARAHQKMFGRQISTEEELLKGFGCEEVAELEQLFPEVKIGWSAGQYVYELQTTGGRFELDVGIERILHVVGIVATEGPVLLREVAAEYKNIYGRDFDKYELWRYFEISDFQSLENFFHDTNILVTSRPILKFNLKEEKVVKKKIKKSQIYGKYISTMMEQAEEKGVDVDELAHEILVLIQKKL